MECYNPGCAWTGTLDESLNHKSYCIYHPDKKISLDHQDMSTDKLISKLYAKCSTALKNIFDDDGQEVVEFKDLDVPAPRKRMKLSNDS